ncbi:TNT domain-containing protein [Saccharopolyspora tripterygii]
MISVRQGDPFPVHPPFPAPAAFGAFPDRTAQLEELLQALRAVAGTGEIRCTALGTRFESDAGDEAFELLRRIRDVGYTPGTGAWTSAVFAGGELRTSFDEPQWQNPPEDGRAHLDELRFYPRRDPAQWLLAPAWDYFVDSVTYPDGATGPLRMLPVFDGRDPQGTPQVFRPAVPWIEKREVFSYLNGGEIVLSAMSTDADELDPQRGAEVPKQFHTDGVWVWPQAMAYYLEEHDIAPPPEFLDHIRRARYQAPTTVADVRSAEAKSLILANDPASMLAHRPEDAFVAVGAHLAAQGVSSRFYSFDEPVSGGWSMRPEPDGWWAVEAHDDRPNPKHRFPDPWTAGFFLIGAMTVERERYLREPDEALLDFECPWPEMADEPPLSSYDQKFVVRLQPGDEIDRFGEPTGNTAFVAGTTLPQRGLPAGREPGPYRRYRVAQPFDAITGIAKPDHGQVGGGTAYVLPNSFKVLSEEGWLVEA